MVSVVGYTLGGGLSWFARRYGWAADGVRAFETVGADGVPARVTAHSDADLFWALRGGGGDFALVTAVELDLHSAPGCTEDGCCGPPTGRPSCSPRSGR